MKNVINIFLIKDKYLKIDKSKEHFRININLNHIFKNLNMKF